MSDRIDSDYSFDSDTRVKELARINSEIEKHQELFEYMECPAESSPFLESGGAFIMLKLKPNTPADVYNKIMNVIPEDLKDDVLFYAEDLKDDEIP